MRRSFKKKMANETELEVFNNTTGGNLILQSRMIRLLDKQGPLPRNDIVIHLNTPRTTIYDNLIKLQKRKVVEKFIKNSGERGRPVVFWKLKEEE